MKAVEFNQNYANKEGFKSLLWIGGAVIALFFFSYIIKAMKAFFLFITGKATEKELNEKNDLEQQKAEKLIKDSGFDPNKLNRPMSYYQGIADELYNAMEGWGTNGTKVVDLCKPLTAIELKAVYLKFGSRINTDFSNDAGNLFVWFGWEFQSWNPLETTSLMALRIIWGKTGLPITF